VGKKRLAINLGHQFLLALPFVQFSLVQMRERKAISLFNTFQLFHSFPDVYNEAYSGRSAKEVYRKQLVKNVLQKKLTSLLPFVVSVILSILQFGYFKSIPSLFKVAQIPYPFWLFHRVRCLISYIFSKVHLRHFSANY
jgi:hypothetical protein